MSELIENRSRHIRVNKCIYCGQEKKNLLTDEHIVPYGLNGNLLLQNASCRDCAKITSQIERRVLRDMWGVPRAQMNMKSYRKKSRPEYASIRFGPEQDRRAIRMPISEAPLMLRLPLFCAPPALSGKEMRSEWIRIQYPGFWEILNVKSAAAKANWETLEKPSIDTQIDFSFFQLLLAKIAYCVAVYYYGLDSFVSVLPNILIDKSLDVNDYVGGYEPPKYSNEGTFVNCISEIRDDSTRILVEISFFGNFGAPVYLVVVGSLR